MAVAPLTAGPADSVFISRFLLQIPVRLSNSALYLRLVDLAFFAQ